MQRLFALLFFPLVFWALSSGFGQTPQRKAISGYIREDGSGHVIKSARIELQNSFGTPIANAYSDGNGAYEFDDLAGGDFYLSVQHDGYETSRQFVRPDGSGHVYIDVFMRVSGSKAATTAANPVSEHQLSIPQKARESFDKGLQLIVEKSDYRGAVSLFARAIAKYPSYYEAYAAMGLAQNRMGDAAAAEASLRKSIDLSGEKYSLAMIDLAALFSEHKRFPEAETLLRKAIAVDASSWRGQFELAVALNGEKRYTDAIVSAAAARDLKPDNPQVYLLLYNLHIRMNDFPAALHDTEAYLKLFPDGAAADRVRRMQEQVQKAVQGAGRNPDSSSDAAPVSPPAGSSVNAPSAPAVAPLPPPGGASSSPQISSTAPASLAALEEAPEPNSASSHERNPVILPRVDELVPEVAVEVPCSLPVVLEGAGRRAEQLLSTLQKFDASERVEHYKLNAAGIPGAADVRSFDYVVSVSHDAQGGFQLQEFRNGGIVRPEQFPSGIITANLSVHGLIFHPLLATSFHFTCEGLGEWKGHPTWLVQFEEKKNDLYPFRSYNINGFRYPLQLTGRAWIDARTFQALRLESDLLKPVEKIRLTREHISIEFASVHFLTHDQQLWLPQTADLYVELDGHRFYRRHTFSNFKIFSTDTTQEVHAPKESYCFTNTTDLLITGVLNATPVSGKAVKPASITLSIPAKSTVCKSVGPGKDVNLPVDLLASTTFAHDGPAGSVEADTYLPHGNAVQLIPNSNIPVTPNF